MKAMIIFMSFAVFVGSCQVTTQAQTLDNIAIHGFGGWAYGQTDNANRYLVGDEDGKYDTVNFSLNLTATPADRLSVYVQTGYNEGGIEENDVGLDYAFAEWYFSDHLRLRAGKVKAPFMLYTEIYDVGTLRPFFSLPQGVYKEYAAEAYKGIGLTGLLYTWNDWEISYDLYGGKLSLQSNPIIDYQNATFGILTPIFKNLIGGRLNIRTPFDGLTVGLSAYRGMASIEVSGMQMETGQDDDMTTLVGGSLEYLSDRWWLRSEYLMQRETQVTEGDFIYAEAAYRLTEHWQAAFRYEWVDMDFDTPEIQYYPSTFIEHEETSIGLNYWFNPNLVLKMSYHFIKGNLLAFPGEAEVFLEDVQQGTFDDSTQLIVLGTQFSF